MTVCSAHWSTEGEGRCWVKSPSLLSLPLEYFLPHHERSSHGGVQASWPAPRHPNYWPLLRGLPHESNELLWYVGNPPTSSRPGERARPMARAVRPPTLALSRQRPLGQRGGCSVRFQVAAVELTNGSCGCEVRVRRYGLLFAPIMTDFLKCAPLEICPCEGNPRIAKLFARVATPISRSSSPWCRCRPCQRSRGRAAARSSNTARTLVPAGRAGAARRHANRPPVARPGRARGPPARLTGVQPCHQWVRTAGSAQAIV